MNALIVINRIQCGQVAAEKPKVQGFRASIVSALTRYLCLRTHLAMSRLAAADPQLARELQAGRDRQDLNS